MDSLLIFKFYLIRKIMLEDKWLGFEIMFLSITSFYKRKSVVI